MNSDPKVVYEFGPFRVDPDKQVLLREGLPIAVTPKAFETLLVLVRRSREVVTKEELLKAIWPDSFVEEANLSQNIFMLRKALGDTLEERQYIVTLPGRGYRFAAPVRTVTDGSEALIAQMRSRTEITIEETAPEDDASVLALPPPTHFRRKWRVMWASAAALSLGTIAAVLLLRHPQRVPLGEKDSVLVGDFTNNTNDPVFDQALRQGLAVQLEQSPYLSLVSEDRIQQALHQMGQPPETHITGPVAREVCVRTSSAAVLEASIQKVGAQYVLNLVSTDCGSGEAIDRQQVQAARKEDILGAISVMTSRFRERVGESRETLRKHDMPLAEATTASLEALKSYSLGLKVLAVQGEEASIPFFRRAVEIDPNFAMAYAFLAVMYGSTGSSRLATENAVKAYELGDHASDNERFFISAYYFGRATGNQEKALQVCEQWAETYPREPLPHAFLSGFVYLVLANYDKAIEEGRRAIELAPDRAFVYANQGENALYVGRYDLSRDALRHAQEHQLWDPRLLVVQYDLAVLEGDRPGMQRAIDLAQGKPDAMDLMADRQAYALAHAGQLKKARVLSRQAISLAQQQGDPERAAQYAIRSALREAFFGNAREAKQGVAIALGLAKNREIEYGAAVASALAGNAPLAQALAEELESEFPEDTSIRFSYLPVIRATLALRRGEPLKAVEALEAAAPYELGVPRCALTGFFGSLYPILLRGEAYLAARKGPEAAREFQTLIDHQGAMIGDPVFVLAHYGLARAFALSRDTNKAREQYREFLADWKDADPDVPILRQATIENEKIH
jgi:DNA-binding winged helix-turn-helix (wHTH) protein/tetratricopeptide (TPR) repeat protein